MIYGFTKIISNLQTISLLNSFVICCFINMKPDTISVIISDITDLPL